MSSKVTAETDTMHLGTTVMRSVKAFIQVLGPQRMPTSPDDADARAWYHKVLSLSTHDFSR